MTRRAITAAGVALACVAAAETPGAAPAAPRAAASSPGAADGVPRAAGAASGAPAARGGAAHVVDVLVVGRSGVVAGPVRAAARARRVAAGRRGCAVGAGTPLAALLAAVRVPVRLRDYGACGARPADGGGLFVTAVGPDANRGQDGWVYKVGRRVGTTGAADPAGPFGTGRALAAGARVTWFYCRMRAGGCQRTLGVSAPSQAVAGGPLRVVVRGYDDQGRGRPVVGAAVAAGGATAVTGAGGAAVITAPAGAARAIVTATAPGAVPGFPAIVALRQGSVP